MNDREKRMKEIGRMFIRDDEIIDENIDLAGYLREYIDDLEHKSNDESLKYEKDYDLLECCKDYLDNPTEENFQKFKESLDVCSVMAAPVAYQFINKYKNKNEYRNQCILLQEQLLNHINANNINNKSM